MEGFFFSYYIDHDQTLALYSNSSFSSPLDASKTVFYVQPVNLSNGGLYGNSKIYEHLINASWIWESVNSSNGYSTLGSMWGNDHEILYVDSVRVSKTGMISLGFAATSIIDIVTPIIIGHKGQSLLLYLASKKGEVIFQGFQKVHIDVVFFNDTASFHLVKSNGDQMSYQGSISCKDNQASALVLKIDATHYFLFLLLGQGKLIMFCRFNI